MRLRPYATPTEPQLSRRHAVLVAAAAVAFAFALALVPGPHRNSEEFALGGVLALAVLCLAGLWQSVPMAASLGAALAYVGMVDLLIDAGGGTPSGFGGLFLLPLLWLAVVGTRLELLLGFVAVGLSRVLPVELIGGPEYPSSNWRTAIVLGAVAAISCVTIQQLVREGRLRAGKLADQNEQLRELDRMKDGFVALVSHELRTPLTSVVGYLELLLEQDAETLTAEQRQYLATVSRNVDRLVTLVNELLTLVQADAGRLELNLARTDIRQLLVEATEAVRPAADAKEIELTLAAGPLAPAVCDRGRIAQLVDNLLSNAVKFTPTGGRVEVKAAYDGAAIALSVSDTGIGIPPDELPRLFGRFFRASSATTNAIPGTGLGLAISQAIAEAHNSTITVTSTPAHGTTFQLRLAAES